MQNEVLMSKDTDKFGDIEEGRKKSGFMSDSLKVLSGNISGGKIVC